MPNLFDANPYMPHDGQQQQDPQAAPQTGSVPPAQGTAIPAADGASTGASSANPFDANPYIPKQQEPQDEGAFMAAVDGFNRQFGRMAESGIRGFESITGLGDKKNLDTYINGQNLQAAQGAMNHPYSAGLGSVLGGLGVGTYGLLGAVSGSSALGLGGALPSTFPGMMALNTGMGGGMAAAGEYGDPNSTPSSVGMGGLKGAATAAGFTAAAGIASPFIRGLSNTVRKAVSPGGAAVDDLAAQVETNGGLPKMAANGADAEALGVTQTPSEVMGKGMNDWEMQQLKKDPNSAVADFAKTRNEQIRNLANDTAHQFTPQGYEAAQAANNQAYEGLKNLEVPTEKILGSNKASNNLIQDELAKMNTGRYSNMTDVPDGSVYKLDKLKQNIDDQIYNSTKNPLAQPEYKLGSSELPTYQQASSDIKNIIDEHHPDTAGIRQDAQRLIFQRRINDQLDNFSPKQGDHGVPTLDAMYDKIWKGSKTNDFLDAVKQSGGDVDNAQKVINLMRDTYQNNVNQVAGQSTLTQANSAKSAVQPGIVSRIIDHTVNKPYEKAMVQLLLSPDWKEQVAQAISPKNDHGKLMGLSNLIGKVAKSTAKSYANGEVRQGLGIDSGVAPSIVPSISSQLAPAFVRGVTNLPPAGLLAAPIGAGVLQAQDYPVVQGLGTVGYTMGNSLMHPLRTLGFDK